jgi:GNAT superfamily N-acetyltransferase
MTLTIAPMRPDHLEYAAALAAARYRALCAQVPIMPARYGERDTLLPMLQNVLDAGPAVVALDGPHLVGFMTGSPIPSFRQHPAVISPEWGNGAEPADSARIYEAMYSRLSAEWVADGRVVHIVVALAHDRDAIDELHWMGFGRIVGDAVRDLTPVPEAGLAPEIRRAGPGDVQSVTRLEAALTEHLAAPPVFRMGFAPGTQEEALAYLEDPSNAIFLATREGNVIAYLLIGPASDDAATIIYDEGTASITGAFTVPSARGAGVATALLNRGLAWAREQGYVRCAVDFETMNPEARRFWLRYFSPVSFGLEREVDARAVESLKTS